MVVKPTKKNTCGQIGTSPSTSLYKITNIFESTTYKMGPLLVINGVLITPVNGLRNEELATGVIINLFLWSCVTLLGGSSQSVSG